MRNGTVFILLAVTLGSLDMHGQWLNYRDPAIPRTRDGKLNMAAPAPLRNHRPDLSGVWQVESSSRQVLSSLFPPGVGLLPGGENGLGEDDPHKYFLNILADYKFNEEPLTPAAAARLRQNLQAGAKPATLCSPPGVPSTELIPSPFKIIQMPAETIILYEGDTYFRQIYTDGRKHPVDPQPSWLGYSIGHWEGDWFVVDAMGFNDKSALDAMGHMHSEDLRVTERFHRKDFFHLEVEITLNDPRTFTKPVTVKINDRLLPDTDLIEAFCTEGESDLAHLPGQ